MRSFFALLLIPAAAWSQVVANPNTDRVANDAYTRSHDYDLVHQRISLRAFDWDSTSFSGTVASTLIALRPNMDSVLLDAGELLNVRRVVGASGATLRHARRGDTLVVFLARPAGFRDTVRFSIDYDGSVNNGEGLTFIAERPHVPRQIWSQGEDQFNHFWFPTYDFPNDKMTWELEASVPLEYSVISNGRVVSDTRQGTSHTVRWSQEQPSATYLVSLIVSPLAKIHDTWRNTPVDYYVYHADSALAPRLFKLTPDMIEVYSKLTGVPYPWPKYAQTGVADFFGGMENVSATTLVDWLPDARAYQDRPWYEYILIPHELAHQWFGDYVTTANWANVWLNEGFAEYMPGQYWRLHVGEKLADEYYADEYRQYMGIEARRPMPLASLESNNVYPKGALVLEMLREYLGDDRFWAGVKQYLTSHALGTATSDDLRQAFLTATGENLNWFFDEWVYGTGHPSFTVSAAYDSVAHRVSLIARQTQRDSLRPDASGLRFIIPDVFRMPVTVRVGTASGDRLTHTWIDQREDTIQVDSVMSPPTMVVFDEGNRILKSLTFDQPTSWLAAQLKRDPDLWNREWIVGELQKRRTDAAAATALAEAATNADYKYTRALAATALGAFPSDAALPPLERALKDTASAVRAAAAASLVNMHDAHALELARTAWRNDSSYAVRTSAFNSLMRLDSAGRHALIAEGLKTLSYRAAIQQAALFAIARLNDTTFFKELQDVLGDQRLVAQVIATLARSNAHALTILTNTLNDERGYVRQWALTMLRAVVPKDRALPALREVQPNLKFKDTREAVAQTLATMSR